MNDSNSGNGAPKDLEVSVKELRNVIDELTSRLEAMDLANPTNYSSSAHCGCGHCGCGHCGCGRCGCGRCGRCGCS